MKIIKFLTLYLIIVLTLCLINYKLSKKNLSIEKQLPINTSASTTDINNSYPKRKESKNFPIKNNTSYNNDRVAKFDAIKSSIDSLGAEYKDNISIYYYNFSTNEKYYYNKDKLYLAASLKKLPLLMEVLDKVNSGDLSLDDQIQYLPTDYSDGTGILQFDDNLSLVSINKLIELSITESDNIAYNMLNRTCNNSLIAYSNENICNNCLIQDNEYIQTSAESVYQVLYKLYSEQATNPYYSKIIEYMKNTQFNDSLNKYLPKNTVAHKIGSYYRSYHDAGIIYGNQTYILIVMTKDIGILTDSPEFTAEAEERYLEDWGAKAFEIMATLSKDIYNIIQ